MKNWIFIILLFAIQSTFGQIYKQKPPSKTRILFVLDGSGSMFGKWGTTSYTKIDVAKKILAQLADSLRDVPDLEIALRVYGHQYAPQIKNCTDSKLEVPFSENNHDVIITKLKNLVPKGNTPIAYSLLQATQDFPNEIGVRNLLILLTDGIESCDGDPCAISLELQKKNIFLKPLVIGLGMEDKYKDVMGCLGRYYNAKDGFAFRKALHEGIQEALTPTSVTVELLDEKNRPLITNVSLTFKNRTTDQPIYDFVHYLDQNKKPDTVFVEPVLDYDLVVHTIPSVIQPIQLKAGKHNIIRIPCPQGKLKIQLPGISEYSKGVDAIVKRKGNKEFINLLPVGETFNYLATDFDIEITTIPKTLFRNFTILPSQVNTITLPGPGVVNFDWVVSGFGALFVNKDNNWEWVLNIPSGTKFTTPLQPGNYKVIFRQSESESKYTETKTFTIATGETKSIKIF